MPDPVYEHLSRVPLLGSKQIARVLKMTTANGSGTCFVFIRNSNTYFVTAKHCVETVSENDHIFVHRDDGPRKVKVCQIRHHETADISVFCSDDWKLSSEDDLNDSILIQGQVGSFLGFPMGWSFNAGEHDFFSLPLMKSCSYSGQADLKENKVHLWDAHNNGGFSGGPIYVSSKNGPTIVGVVSGFQFDKGAVQNVYKKVGDTYQKLADYYVRPNSGFMVSYHISCAYELMDEILIT